MAFTLLLVGCLDEGICSVTFQKWMCMICNLEWRIMGTIQKANSLHCLVNAGKGVSLDHANIAADEMSISEAHQKLSHISHSAIWSAISTGWITGIELDMDLK